MSNNISEAIINNFLNSYSTDGHGDNVPEAMFSGLTTGVVVDTDDPLQQGRLRIFCPNLNDNPKKVESIPWSVYVSPFGGSINNSSFYRGVENDNATSEGSLHYGFWSIPEMGAHVLVGCIDGDPRRRYWLGCFPEHQQTNTMHNGRFKWRNGYIDGPLTGSGQPLQPLFDNMLEAFDNQNDRPEFLSRVVDYQVSANSQTVGQNPNSKNTDLDQENQQILENSPDEWTHHTLGAHGNDWSGFKKLGAFMSSRAFGWSTPGMHAITMDDRPFNQKIKLRTTNGHQLILDDTNERIYINTAKGKVYMEMDQRGDLHVYANKNINFNAEDNINLNADKIRMYARRGIHGYCGSQYVLQDSFSDIADPSGILRQAPLEVEPQDGEIRFHSSADFHIKSETNIRQLSVKDTYMEANGSWYGRVDESSYYEVNDEINIITNKGDYSLNVGNKLNETVSSDAKRFAFGKNAVASNGDIEVMSFEGSTDIGALDNLNMKSSTSDITIAAQGNNNGSGNLIITTPDSQFSVGGNGVTAATTSSVKIKSAESTEISITSEKPNLSSPIAVDGIPEVDSGATPVGPTGPLPWDGSRSSITIDEAVRVAYEAGWRGKDLTIAVAVMMAESSLRTSVTNKAAPQNEKWGDVVGLFQIRCLKNPDKYTGIDRLRDNRDHKLENPNTNAKVAYAIWAQATPPRQWTVGKWESFGGKHQGRLITNNLPAATEAVNRYLGITNNAPQSMRIMYQVGNDMIDSETVNEILPFALNPLIAATSSGSSMESAFKLDGSLATIQGKNDINLRSVVRNNINSYNSIVSKINEISATINQSGMFLNTLIEEVTKGLATAGSFTLELPFKLPVGCFDMNLYDLLPEALLEVAATLDDLNAMLEDILEVPITLFNIKEQLEGNIEALTRLGLPLDFTINVDPSIANCLSKLDNLATSLDISNVPLLQAPSFDALTAQIMSNNALRI